MSLIFARDAIIITFKSILNSMISLYRLNSQGYWSFYQKLTHNLFQRICMMTGIIHLWSQFSAALKLHFVSNWAPLSLIQTLLLEINPFA